MIEKPSTGKAKIFKDGQAIEVQIPTRKNWFEIGFWIVWLCGWLNAEIFGIGQVFDSDRAILEYLFLIVWLTFWTLAGAFTIAGLLWVLTGQEVIVIDSGIMEIGKQMVGFARAKSYDINEIRQLSLNLSRGSGIRETRNKGTIFFPNRDVLKFDYGLATLKFGDGIDEAEGRLLIELFKVNPNFKEKNFV